jgi:hypothetical protein
MISGLPIVSLRNIFKSELSRQGKPPSRPITPFWATATTNDKRAGKMLRTSH